MEELKISEDIDIQTISKTISGTVTILGEAPQYIKDPVSNEYILVTEDMPYWKIKKISTVGIDVITRSANGSTKHDKRLSQWATYTY